MKKHNFIKFKFRSIFLFLVLAGIFANAQAIPRLEKRGQAVQLIVNDQPWLVLGGELHNSSASNLDYLEPIFPKLKAMNLNTVLAVVSWDQFEPVEGQYDYTLMDGMIKQARENDLKLVLLWFGSWKNGQSHYIPDWVKADYKRFPRVKTASGKALEILTPLSENTLQADLKAFTAFMKHLKEIDSQENTVIMIQVQNEVGIIGETRDYSPEAEKSFTAPVPSKLMNYLSKNKNNLAPELTKTWSATGYKTKGSWSDVFGGGPAAEELFMAWNYASFIDKLAEMGKKEYTLPMFVNAWIVQPQDKRPGDYPSGGPQAHVHDIWRAAADHIDILAPDIYLPEFTDICAQYMRSGTPLFVPESFSGYAGAANAFYAVGAGKAIGYSPFGIDGRMNNSTDNPFAQAYNILAQLSPSILKAQSSGNISSVILNSDNPKQSITLGDYKVTIALASNWRSGEAVENGYGLLIASGKDEFIAAGSNVHITFLPASQGPAVAGLASVEEGVFENGKWIAGRRLNGDAIMVDYDLGARTAENRTGTGLKFQAVPSIQKVKLYRFE